jgi:hypothetical protein
MAAIFPGIDPFVESQHYWPDFHFTFLAYLREAIGDVLPDSYLIRVEERVYVIDQLVDDLRLIRPDLTIEKSTGRPIDRQGAVALEIEPTTIPLTIPEEFRERHLEIIHRTDRTLVAVIELLSPENKAEPGFRQYLAKRNALLRSPVHVVELDFLLGGHRLPMEHPLPAGDFYALVARGNRRPDCDVYAWSIRQSLTSIRLPLLAPDPDLRLDLGATYATAFQRGRYDRSIDYSAPLSTPLSPEDRAWAEELARSAR